MVEMVFRTSQGKIFSTIEEAEKDEIISSKKEKFKEYFESFFEMYKEQDDGGYWCLYSLDKVADEVFDNFEHLREIVDGNN